MHKHAIVVLGFIDVLALAIAAAKVTSDPALWFVFAGLAVINLIVAISHGIEE